MCWGRRVLEKGQRNGALRNFVLEISALKMHTEATDVQDGDLKTFEDAVPSQTVSENAEWLGVGKTAVWFETPQQR